MLASLTGLLLTLGGEGPAIVFIPPLDPEVFDWNPDELTLEYLGPETDPVGFSFFEAGIEQSMVFLRSVLFLEPTSFDLECYTDDFCWFGNTQDCLDATNMISPRAVTLDAINFGYGSGCSRTFQFLELEGLLQSTRRVDEILDRLESLEQKVETLEQSLESCQCASDLDGDGAVGFNDLVQLISDWGPCSV